MYVCICLPHLYMYSVFVDRLAFDCVHRSCGPNLGHIHLSIRIYVYVHIHIYICMHMYICICPMYSSTSWRSIVCIAVAVQI